MSSLKNKRPTKFLWVDLEMTGLDLQTDVILEIAAIITDAQFNKIGETYYARVRHDPEVLKNLFAKNEFWAKYAKSRDEFIEKTAEGKTIAEIDEELSALIAQNFPSELAVLAGNSIHSDKKFIERDWPKSDALLHYRLLDVSSWKVVMSATFDQDYDKPEIHRADSDINASIEELKHYLNWFKKKSDD